MCDAEGSYRVSETERTLVLQFLEENGIEGDEAIYREDLYKNLRCYQELYGVKTFNIRERTPMHFYCPELSMTLQDLLFRRCVEVDTKWNGGFEQYWGITEWGKEWLVLKRLEKERNRLEDIEKLVLLIDVLDSFTYEKIQKRIRENDSVFNEYFNGLHDIEGVAKPVSRKLNYHLNMLEMSGKIRFVDGVYHKTEALEREANRIRAALKKSARLEPANHDPQK